MKIRIFFPALFACFLFSGISYADFFNSAPVFPGSEKVKEEKIDADSKPVYMWLYKTKADPGDVILFYRKEYEKAGWFLSYMDSESAPTSLSMKNKNKELVVGVRNFAEFFPGKASEDKFILVTISETPQVKPGEPLDIPDDLSKLQDSQGSKDVPNVPRYPQSVRVSSVATSTGMQVSYITSSTVEQVMEFYRNSMLSNGWKGNREVDFADFKDKLKGINLPFKMDGKSLVFKGHGGICYINVIVTDNPVIKKTIIGIKYEKL